MPDFLNLYNVFLAVGLFSTLFYFIKLILFMFLGSDVEVHADFDTITETDASFNFFSIQSILAFFMGFGWTGLTMLVQVKTSSVVAFAAAFFVGAIFMFISAYFMLVIKKLNKRVVKDLNELVNQAGRTYTAFEPKSIGQIEINFNNKLSILDAVNLSDEKIDAFTIIKVVKVDNNQIYIEKVQ